MKNIIISLALLAFTLPNFAQQVGLYNGTETLTGSELKASLHSLIDDHTVVDYYDTKYVLAVSDRDPNNSDNIIEVYTGWSHDATDYGSGDALNREHVWAKSHGDFFEVYPMFSDIHNLKPADASVNSSRGNKDFANGGEPHVEAPGCFATSTSWEPRDEVKGDVARIVFYMATRYEGENGEVDLEVNNLLENSPTPFFGKLDDLLTWNEQDPPNAFERNRNNVIEASQKNRNPFIDNPEWINYIWAGGEPESVQFSDFQMAPQFPTPEDMVEISLEISDLSTSANVTLKWGESYEGTASLEMGSSDGRWHAILPQQPVGTKIYFHVQAEEDGELYSSITYTYLVELPTLAISEIQGSGTESPFDGQEVKVRGVVTAVYGANCYLQESAEKRSGIYINNAGYEAQIGDQIAVIGEVDEYYGMTTLKNVTSVLENSGVDLPAMNHIVCGDVGEDYESMLIRVTGAECTLSDWEENDDIWVVTDETGSLNVKNNSTYQYSNPQFGENYHVQGPLGFSGNTWRIYPRSSADIEIDNGVETYARQRLSIYPNPASGSVTITIPPQVKQQYSLEVRDLLGRQQLIFKNQKSVNGTAVFSISSLVSGAYILVLSAEETGLIFTEQLIVE